MIAVVIFIHLDMSVYIEIGHYKTEDKSNHYHKIWPKSGWGKVKMLGIEKHLMKYVISSFFFWKIILALLYKINLLPTNIWTIITII